MESPYLDPLPPYPTEKVGEAGRKAQRTRNKLAAMRRADVFLQRELPELLADPPVPVADRRVLAFAQLLFEHLSENVGPQYAIDAAFNRFCAMIDAGNRAGAWAYPAIPRTHQLPRQCLLRTTRWQQHSTRLHSIDAELMTAIGTIDDTPVQQGPVLIGLALYFAAILGSACTPSGLVALARGIVDDTPILGDASSDELWMTLIQHDARVTNVTLNDKQLRLDRSPINLLTLALVHRFRASDRSLPTEKLDGTTLIRWINEALSAVGVTARRFASLKRLCSVALSIEEQYTDIPETLYETAMGRVATVDLPESHWRTINQLASPTLCDVPDATTIAEADASTPPTVANMARRHIGNDEICTALAESLEIRIDGRTEARPRPKALARLCRLKTDGWPIAGCMLHAWYRHHLEVRGNEVGTVRKYHSAIGRGLLDALQDLDAYDADDLDEAYRRVIDARPTEKAQDDAAHRLTDLHSFAMAELGLPSLHEPLIVGGERSKHVRAAFIPESVYRRGYAAIDALTYRSNHYKARLEVLWIIAYRTGLRRNDLLRLQLRDIETGKGLMLKVRNNQLGSGKTDNARRLIPLAVLLTKSEHANVSHFIAEQRKRHGARSNVALFDVEGSPKERIDPKHVTNDVTTVLASVGHPGILHDFRHTAISRLFLIGEREWALVKRFSGYSKTKARAIYKTVFGHRYVKASRYYALAAFAGHASPGITFEHYVHFCRVVLQARLRRSQRTHSAKSLSKLLGISERRIRSAARRAGVSPDQIPLNCVRPLVMRECRKSISVVRRAEPTPPPAIKIRCVLETGEKFWTAFAALSDWQRGYSLSTICYDHGLSQAQLNTYVDNGIKLANERTRVGKPRLFSQDRQETRRQTIVPSVPTSPLLTLDVRRIVDGFRDRYRGSSDPRIADVRQDIEWAAIYWLTHTMTTAAFAVFHDPDDLRRFLATCKGIVPDDRWFVELAESDPASFQAERQRWGLAQRYLVKPTSKLAGSNSARLHLRHPNDREIIAQMQQTLDSNAVNTRQWVVKKYSAHTLRFVFHMMAITMFSTERLAKALDAVAQGRRAPSMRYREAAQIVAAVDRIPNDRI